MTSTGYPFLNLSWRFSWSSFKHLAIKNRQSSTNKFFLPNGCLAKLCDAFFSKMTVLFNTHSHHSNLCSGHMIMNVLFRWKVAPISLIYLHWNAQRFDMYFQMTSSLIYRLHTILHQYKLYIFVMSCLSIFCSEPAF